MCGIIGIASNKSVTSNIINSLKRLEYRGYDSAGIATISKKNLNEKKCSGRVEELEKILFILMGMVINEHNLVNGKIKVDIQACGSLGLSILPIVWTSAFPFGSRTSYIFLKYVL